MYLKILSAPRLVIGAVYKHLGEKMKVGLAVALRKSHYL